MFSWNTLLILNENDYFKVKLDGFYIFQISTIIAMNDSNKESSSINGSHQTNFEELLNYFPYIDGYLKTSHLIMTAIGIPLNLGVIALVVGMKRLHLQRTFTWLGVGFANVFLLLYHLIELHSVSWPSPVAKKICFAIRGLPYMVLLLGNLLSFLERQICIKYSKWYKLHITNFT